MTVFVVSATGVLDANELKQKTQAKYKKTKAIFAEFRDRNGFFFTFLLFFFYLLFFFLLFFIAGMLTLRQAGRWNSTTPPLGYVERSASNRRQIGTGETKQESAAKRRKTGAVEQDTGSRATQTFALSFASCPNISIYMSSGGLQSAQDQRTQVAQQNVSSTPVVSQEAQEELPDLPPFFVRPIWKLILSHPVTRKNLRHFCHFLHCIFVVVMFAKGACSYLCCKIFSMSSYDVLENILPHLRSNKNIIITPLVMVYSNIRDIQK